MEKKDCPTHLHELYAVVEKLRYMTIEPDREAYANIAFMLLGLDGPKPIIKAISEYIQNQHRRLEMAHSNRLVAFSDLNQFLTYAALWLDRRPKPRKTGEE